MDLLRDPLWQFVGVVLSLAALMASFVFYKKQANYKRLSGQVLDQFPVLIRWGSPRGTLQVLYNGKEIYDITSVVIKIFNSGNAPILPADYEQPISINFGQGTEIINADLYDASPANIGAEIKTLPHAVQIAPVLLNAGDTIKLRILLSGFKGNVKIDSRIIGVGLIDRPDQKRARLAKTADFGFLFIMQGGGLFLGAYIISLAINQTGIGKLLLGLFGISICVLALTAIRSAIKDYLERRD